MVCSLFFRGTASKASISSRKSLLYLWFYSTTYYLTTKHPDEYADTGIEWSTTYGKCNIPANHPLDCGSNWYTSRGLMSTSMTLLSCPVADCDSVRTSLSDAYCPGPFNVSVGSNAWSNEATGYTLSFFYSPMYDHWFCGTDHDLSYSDSSMPQSVTAWAEKGWTRFVKPQSYTQTFEWLSVGVQIDFDGSVC